MIRIDQIKISDRLREDMGDIQALAESIKAYGLLHPIVVNTTPDLTLQYELIAGGRRLEACKLLGWTEISAKLLFDLSATEMLAIELEENIRRKDLTEAEKSKNLVELAEIKGEELREYDKASPTDIQSPSDQKPNEQQSEVFCEGRKKVGGEQSEVFAEARQKLIGRPSKPDSEAKIAEAIGVPRQTLLDARQHVAAIDKYPELEPLPKMQAIQTAKQLDQIPEEQRADVIPLVTAKQETYLEDGLSEEERKQLRRAETFTTNVDRLISRLTTLSGHKAHEYFDGLPAIAFILGKAPIFSQNKLDMIDMAIEFLQGFRMEWVKRMIEPEQSGIRRVK